MFYKMPSYSLSLPDSDNCLTEYRTVGDRCFKRWGNKMQMVGTLHGRVSSRRQGQGQDSGDDIL